MGVVLRVVARRVHFVLRGNKSLCGLFCVFQVRVAGFGWSVDVGLVFGAMWAEFPFAGKEPGIRPFTFTLGAVSLVTRSQHPGLRIH